MLDYLKNQLSHNVHPTIQFLKYGIVGGLATATHIIIFFSCGWFLFPCLTQDDITIRMLGLAVPTITETTRAWNAGYCNAGGFLISNSVCYVLNRLFVFKPGRHHWLMELTLFFAVSGVSMLLGTTLQTVLITQQSIQTTLAFGANIGVSLLINYAMRKYVIFKG